MNLADAISAYVKSRRAGGSAYVNGESVLRAMCRQIGNVQMMQLTAVDVSRFLANPRCSACTQRGQYSLVRRFLLYWLIREEAAALDLPMPPRGGIVFIPYVHGVSQISSILSATEVSQRTSRILSAKTFRMFLLTLYATGAVFNEVLQLRSSQVDISLCKLNLCGDRRIRKRCIPICPDLCKEMKDFLGERRAICLGDFNIFAEPSGKLLTRNYLIARFSHLLRVAGITRDDGIQRSPRMQDFRATFAVHRLQACLKDGHDLDRLLPSLSAYMGYASLCGAEKYLRLAPDHLLSDISKLSEHSCRSHWRDDLQMMDFVARSKVCKD